MSHFAILGLAQHLRRSRLCVYRYVRGPKMFARTRAGRTNALTVALGMAVFQLLLRLARDGSLLGAFVYALLYFVPIFAVALIFNELAERCGWFEPGRVMAPRERQERARLAGIAFLPALVLSVALSSL